MSQVITATAVNELRKRTDMPMMECKSALTEAEGDMNKAIQILRERNSKVSVKRSTNETAEGRISVYIDAAKSTAAILDMRCESAPVTKSEAFMGLANDLARQIVETNPASVEALLAQPCVSGSGTVTERIQEVIGLIRENMKPHRFVRMSGGQFGEYIHHDGTLGVLLHVQGSKKADATMLRDICSHIAALNPQYTRIEEVPADIIAREKELARQQVESDPKNVGKPANIIEKIIDGKLRACFAESVLLEQLVANQTKYEKKTVGQVLNAAGLVIERIVRYKVGEVAL